MLGITEEGVRKAFQTEHVCADGKTIVRYKNLVRLCREYQLQQLTPGPGLNSLVGSALDHLKCTLSHKSILDRGEGWYAELSPVAKDLRVSLYQWVSDIFIETGTNAYFGSLLQEIEPDLTKTFMRFERLSWQAMYQYPKLLCGDMIHAKQKVQDAMVRYFAECEQKRVGGSWFIRKIEEEMKRLEISSDDSAIFFFQLYWR